MIQLANDPHASRMGFRPAPNEAKGFGSDKRIRGGHAWPFISRHAGRPTQPATPKNSAPDSGS
jgi:hypothetical protein